METAIAWLLTFAPITMSPGPSNMLLASSSATVGVRKSLPALFGIVFIFVLQIAAVGVGIGEMLFRYPALFTVFQYIGAAFLLYLAYLFFRSSGSSKGQTQSQVGFREGALLQFFNFKALTVPLIMFTQFISPQSSSWNQIMSLTRALLVLIVVSLGIWTVGGSVLQRFFQSEFGMKWQGKIFGGLLVLVAVWMLMR